jgi:hypothetical protein
MSRQRLQKLREMARCSGSLAAALEQPIDVVGPLLRERIQERLAELDTAMDELTEALLS